MKLHIINLYLSRLGGGIFTVIKELYNSSVFKNSSYAEMNFWGYEDLYSAKDTSELPGHSYVFNPPIKKINKLLYSKKFSKELNSSIKKNDIIHLHCLWLYPSYLTSKIQSTSGVKKIVSIHGMLDDWALENSRLRKKVILKLYEKRNLDTMDCIHALCEQEYKDIRKISVNTPIAIIPNGINLPTSLSFKKKSHNNVHNLLFLGRIHPKKGLKNLLFAWAQIKNENWKLTIAGPDENNHLIELVQLSKKLKIDKSILFVGPKFGKEKDILLSNADAFILPSYSEGLPMSILEAWSYQLPVLMTPQCNLPDGFITNSAIRIETEPDSIILGLNRLFQMNDTSLKEMGENGFNLVKEKYSWDTVAGQMIELYDWVSGKIEKPSFIKLD